MKKFAALIIVLVIFLQCTNNKPLPNGYELLDRDNKVGIMPPITIKPISMATFWRAEPAGSRANLLLGTGQESSSFIIFKCRNLARIETDATIVSARLGLYSSQHIGELAPFTFTAHKVDQDWNENTVVWNDVNSAFTSSPLETWEFTPGDTAWYSFQFTDLDFIASWVDDSHESDKTIHGLLLKFDQAPGGTQFYASEASTFPPYIEVISENTQGSRDTTVAYITEDASLLQNTAELGENTLVENPAILRAGNASGYRSLLQFDLSELPKEATIHKALLTFQIDHDNLYPKDQAGANVMSVAAAAVDTSATMDDISTVVIAPRYTPAVDAASSANETFAFNSATANQTVSRIIQRWVSGTVKNNGMLIYPYNFGTSFQEMAFNSDEQMMPSIEITYSLPAAHRFARE